MHTSTSSLLITAIKKVTARTIRDFGELEKMLTEPKTAMEFALSCDTYVKEMLCKDLSKVKKNYSIQVDNVSTQGKDSSNKFIIHGLVGLDNFYRCMPYFCLAISLERDSQLFATAIYNPISNEMFYAEKEVGVFFNNKKIVCNQVMEKSLDYIALDKEAMGKVNCDKYQGVWISSCKMLDLCYLAVNKINHCLYLGKEDYWLLYPAIFLLKESGVKVEYSLLEDNSQITKVVYEI